MVDRQHTSRSSILFARYKAFVVSNTLMSNPITDAVADANDEAVTMLRDGDNDHARASFQRALEVIQQYLKMSSFPGGPPDVLTCRYSPTQHIRGQTNSIIVSVALGDYELPESQSTTPENPFSFYNHAFVFRFRPNMVTRSSQEETYFNMLTFVLVFNMALTHHRRGLVDERNSSQNLRKAIRLYQLATTTSLLANQDGFQDLHTLELASWNNMCRYDRNKTPVAVGFRRFVLHVHGINRGP